MRKRRFIINVFIMSASMLIIRIVGMTTNIYISAKAGASAMGIYHIIFSVFTFGITFAASGTGFAVTRLVAESRADEGSTIKKCLAISAVMSFVGFLFFFAGAPFIQKHFIKQSGAAAALRLLAFALPCMGASSVYRGYFIAKRNAGVITASSMLEEGVCIGVNILLLQKFAGTPKAYMCLVYGYVTSNLTAFLFDSASCIVVLRKSIMNPQKANYRAIFAICVPIALGSYLRTALVAVENLMIPLQFEKFGVANPVGEYGVIKAMAMSILMFPTVFIQAFSSMLVPEMSEMNASGRKNGIRYVSSLAISTVMMFSVFIALMLLKHHGLIGRSFFKEPRVSYYLGLLALLAVPMYLDTVADSILKGLNLQNSSLKYNIIDSCLRIISMLILMPKLGPVFYIAMLYISEIFNLTLSLGKAARITGLKPDWFKFVILPFGCAFAAFWIEAPIWQAVAYIGMYMIFGKMKKE